MNAARPIPAECPFWERHVTLGRLMDGTLTFAQNKSEKREMLLDAHRLAETGAATFFVAWTGQWTTNLFTVSVNDLVEWLADGGLSRTTPR